MDMRKARFLIESAYASRDTTKIVDAHRAACHASIDDATEAAAPLVVARAELGGSRPCRWRAG